MVKNGWKHERIRTSLGTSRLVSALEKAVLSRNQGPSVPRDVDGRVAILNLTRVRDPFSVFFFANARFADLKVWRNRDTISFYVVAPKGRRKRKIWSLLKNRAFVTRVKCLQHTWRKVPTNTVFRKTHWCRGGYWKSTLKTCSVHWGDGYTPAIAGVRANDLEQLMRETFRVRVCERVDPGFLTTVEILRRKVAWNVEDFFWIYDPKHTVALADEFGFVGKKQLEQTKNILVALGSKTMNKGLHDGADVLDERETQQCRSLIDTALNDGQDRPETQYTTEESAKFMSDPTRAVKCMLKRLRKHYSEASVHSWSFQYQDIAVCQSRE